ncbi:MAG: Hsp33 family molecular chaperone HslO [Clostridiales bacterium]|nr:Hsp33 family molecular chaperone HslO [Clostridiales bacterium]
MKDHIVRAVTADGLIRADAITSRYMTERARQIHRCLPLGTAALGRTLAAASMMGAQLKNIRHSITVQIRGDGPLGSLCVVSDGEGNVRGYMQNPGADLPLRKDGKIDVGGGVGLGQMVIIRDMGLKEPYIGMVELKSGEIAEDITEYLVKSDQIPSACALGVLVDVDQSVLAAGGYILQLLPGADDNAAERLEEAVNKLGPVTALLNEGMSPADILLRLLNGLSPKILAEMPVEYRCYCSEERITGALKSMGKAELLELSEEQDSFEITCQFCDRQYRYSSRQLREMAEQG